MLSLTRELSKNTKYGAVIIETRCIKDLEAIVKNHLYFLPPDWGVTFFHGHANKEYVINALKDIRNVQFISLPLSDMPTALYNKLLTTPSFWKSFSYEKVLIFQSDSVLLRHGIEEFLQYDYVGAPWRFQNHGGNGGLSLRSADAMRTICNAIRYNPSCHGNEDVFFSNMIHDKYSGTYNLAPREICEQFACESLFRLNTLGAHAIEKYLSSAEVKAILNQIKYTP